jgi:hypothetical protein
MSLPNRILPLSDTQLESVMSAAQPLAPSQRPLFLEALARQQLGDGGPPVIRSIQRDYWDPPAERGARHRNRR